uniref:Uncharacterized protein n=1 Tax=Oryza glumipatula TaxID=40148 RepID=A0A0E0AP92_9ORYZ
MGASSLLDELDIMFTVIGFGLVVITANFVVLPHRDIKLLPVVVAIWALGFIAGKIAYKQEIPSAPFFLAGLAITGYGMGVCFSGCSLGVFGVYFIIGLIVIIAGSKLSRPELAPSGTSS